jgi:hypothetical protein
MLQCKNFKNVEDSRGSSEIDNSTTVDTQLQKYLTYIAKCNMTIQMELKLNQGSYSSFLETLNMKKIEQKSNRVTKHQYSGLLNNMLVFVNLTTLVIDECPFSLRAYTIHLIYIWT